MNRHQLKRDAAGARRSVVVPTLRLFLEMAVEEWRKLSADAAHAFARRVNHPAAADLIEEKRFGDQ